MSVGEECRKALKTIEEYEREVNSNLTYVKASIENAVFSVKGRVPDPLEEAELLDAVCTFFSLKRDDMLNIRIFRWLFMTDLDNARLLFFNKLVSLAVCLPVTPVLELAAVWIKCTKGFSLAAFTFNFLVYLDKVFLSNKKNAQFVDPLLATSRSCPSFTEAFLVALTDTFSFVKPINNTCSPVNLIQYQRLLPKSFNSLPHPPSLFTLQYLCSQFFESSTSSNAVSSFLWSKSSSSNRALDYFYYLDCESKQSKDYVNKIIHQNISLRSAFGGLIRWIITYPLYNAQQTSIAISSNNNNNNNNQSHLICSHVNKEYDQALNKIHIFLFTNISLNLDDSHSSSVHHLLPPNWLADIVDSIQNNCLPITPTSPTMESHNNEPQQQQLSSSSVSKSKRMKLDEIENNNKKALCSEDEFSTDAAMKLCVQRLAEYILLLYKVKVLPDSREEIKNILQPLSHNSFVRMLLKAI